MPQLGDGGTGQLELRLRELHLSHKSMQMTHGRTHDLAKSGVLGAFEFCQDGGGDVELVFNDHGDTLASLEDDPIVNQW